MPSFILRAAGLAALAMGLLCAVSAVLAPASAMDFRAVNLALGKCGKRVCPGVMVATGEISPETTGRFLAFAQQAARDRVSNVLILDSPGGRLIESLRLGMMLRKLRTSVFVGRVVVLNGQNVVVNGSCQSACVYAFMGGGRRFVTTGSQVGVHREFLPNSTGSDPLSVLRSARRFPEVTKLLRDYSQAMGVSPALIDLAEQYGGGGMRLLTPQDIVRFRLAKIAK